jgi:mono/diheme cytochrome c family protein
VPGSAYSGHAERGGILARTWCAHCHIVEENQEQASDSAPAFAEVANNPSKSTLSITVWLNDPHPPMPNLSLSQDEIDDLVTYIKSLKTD